MKSTFVQKVPNSVFNFPDFPEFKSWGGIESVKKQITMTYAINLKNDLLS